MSGTSNLTRELGRIAEAARQAAGATDGWAFVVDGAGSQARLIVGADAAIRPTADISQGTIGAEFSEAIRRGHRLFLDDPEQIAWLRRSVGLALEAEPRGQDPPWFQ